MCDRISQNHLPQDLRRLLQPQPSRESARNNPFLLTARHRGACAGSVAVPGRGKLRHRCGFSVAELLVVTGILIALIALLLPLIGRIRDKAVDVVCTGRLQQLLVASTQYATMNGGAFPAAAGEGQSPAVPNMLPARLLNDLRAYIGYPTVTPGAMLANLPPAMQCPRVERLDGARPFEMKGLGGVVVGYYTGYAYVGGLGRGNGLVKPGQVAPRPFPPGQALPRTTSVVAGSLGTGRTVWAVVPPLPTTAAVLRPGRAAGKMGDPGALWTDDVSLSWSGDGSWRFAHPRRGAAGGTEVLTYADPRGCQGQHRAYAEGRVEWIPAEKVGLPGGQVQAVGVTKAASALDAASYKAGSGYWWF